MHTAFIKTHLILHHILIYCLIQTAINDSQKSFTKTHYKVLSKRKTPVATAYMSQNALGLFGE